MPTTFIHRLSHILSGLKELVQEIAMTLGYRIILWQPLIYIG